LGGRLRRCSRSEPDDQQMTTAEAIMTTDSLEPAANIDVARARQRVRPLRIIGGLLIASVTLAILWFLVTNERFDWPVVAEYLFNGSVLLGLGVSLMLTA